MNEINTSHFGLIRYNEFDAVSFPAGLPGFLSCRRFILLPDEKRKSISYLQSLDRPELRFILVSTETVDPQYKLVIESWDASVLFPSPQVYRDAELTGYFVLSAPEGREPTVNMVAPIVLRPSHQVGVQAVRADSAYSHQAKLSLFQQPAQRQEHRVC